MLIRDILVEEANPNPNVYDIPEWNVEKLVAIVDKLNKRAAKLGVPPVRIDEVGKKQVKDSSKHYPGLKPEEIPTITVYQLKIEGEPPKLAGWTFLATLDHNTMPGQVVVNTVPGQSIPREFFTAQPVCDHCNKARRRNETFVLRHDDGKYMKVGRQCLRDFLGHDPSRAVAALQVMFNLIAQLGNMDDDNHDGGGSSRIPPRVDKETVLIFAAAVINKEGWVPRSASNETRPATVTGVQYAMFPPYRASEYETAKWRDYRNSLDLENEKFKQEAQAAIKWLEEQPDGTSEYMHNLKLISKADGVPVNMLGYWVSLIAAYHKAQDRQRLAASNNANKVNEYFGNVGDKIEVEVTLNKITHIPSQWGAVHLHNFSTKDGRTLTWFANTGNADMEQGKQYKIKGTIKKHAEFNNWKQTQLTRVKKVQDL